MTRAILSTARGCLHGVRELLLVALGGLPRERIDEVIRERDAARRTLLDVVDCNARLRTKLADAARQRDTANHGLS